MKTPSMAQRALLANHPLPSRRTFLADVGMGFTGLALGAMLARDDVVRAGEPAGLEQGTHFPPKAKSVIWVFLVGGLSHMESFDPKPALNKYAGQDITETPFAGVLKQPEINNLRLAGKDSANGKTRNRIYPMQIGWRRRGQSGLEISDWFPHLGGCADDLALVRSMWGTDNNHSAQLQFHTGRHILEGAHPTIGSWVHYGLGALSDNLPQFVVLGTPLGECCGGVGGHGGSYLGPEHFAVPLSDDPLKPLPYPGPSPGVFREEQQENFELLGKLNRLAAVEYPNDPAMQARIRSYELAYRMQTAVPEMADVKAENAETQSLYGLERDETKSFGRQCLMARRLVERGVRFIQIFHGGNRSAGLWDAHLGLKKSYDKLCNQVDQPLAALIQDLKRRGMLEETLVVIATEFGRTPGAQFGDGRDHHPFGFSVALAGGGVRGGIAHGRTDELGFHAVENRHYVTDLHATVLHQLGLDHRRMEIPGRKRLEIDFGEPIHEII